MKKASLWTIFYEFLKIGAFTFGGGYAMISMVERALVKKRHWLSDMEFWECIALAQALPGVFAVNMALYTGHRINGKKGAGVAAAGAVLPSVVIICLIASFFYHLHDNETVQSIFTGIRPCVVALIFAPGLKMLRKAMQSDPVRPAWVALLIALLVMVLICGFAFSPVYIIIGAMVAGAIMALGRKPRHSRESQEKTKSK